MSGHAFRSSFILLASWLLLLVTWPTYAAPQRSSAFVRREAELLALDPSDVDMVVARYQEDLTWLDDLKNKNRIRLHVYNKGGPAHTPTGFKSTEVTRLANPSEGREAHTYLYHILQNYDRLADWTIFTQGDPNTHFPAFRSFLGENPFDQSSSRLQCLSCQYLPNIPTYANCEARHSPMAFGIDPFSFQVISPQAFADTGVDIFMKVQSEDLGIANGNISSHFCRMIGITPPSGPVDFCYASEFLVHRSRITQHPRILYEAMWRYLMKPLSTGLPPDVNCADCQARSKSGYIVERMWFYLFEADRV